MIKKNDQKKLILTCVLLTAMFVLVTYMTKQGPNASAAPDASGATSAETPAEKLDLTPAAIGGAAAIIVYYGGSLIIGAVKGQKGGKTDPKSGGKANPPSSGKSQKKK